MRSLKLLVLATAVTVAHLPMSAGAFGFGASKHDYPPGPWGYGPAYPPPGQAPQTYAPPQAMPQRPGPYGPPPGARDVRGMWGSGPGMGWGSRGREDRYRELDAARERDRARNPWKWSDAWESPYKNAPPWVSPYDAPPGRQRAE